MSSDRPKPSARAPVVVVAALVASAALGGCSSCSGTTKRDPEPEQPAPSPVDLPPVATAWSFAPLSGRTGLATPAHCTDRGPPLRAAVAPATRMVADPRTLGALFVAEVDPESEEVTAAALFRLDQSGALSGARPVPWRELEPPPRLAIAPSNGVLAAQTWRAGKAGRSIGLWRAGAAEDAGSATEPLGAGDEFEAVDLACGPSRCALLTTRQSKVAAPGAEVRFGPPADPIASWRTVEIAPAAGDSDAEPALLASVEPLVVALLEGNDVAFFDAEAPPPAPPREIARLPAPVGLLDAASPLADGAPRPIALVHGAPIREDGCTDGTPGLRIERAGAKQVLVPTPAAPFVAALRPLARGLFAVWLSPLGCVERGHGDDEREPAAAIAAARRVVYGLVLSPDGTPASEPIPLGDGDSFTVAASGADVDVWIRHAPTPGSTRATVSWQRLSCAAP